MNSDVNNIFGWFTFLFEVFICFSMTKFSRNIILQNLSPWFFQDVICFKCKVPPIYYLNVSCYVIKDNFSCIPHFNQLMKKAGAISRTFFPVLFFFFFRKRQMHSSFFYKINSTSQTNFTEIHFLKKNFFMESFFYGGIS